MIIHTEKEIEGEAKGETAIDVTTPLFTDFLIDVV